MREIKFRAWDNGFKEMINDIGTIGFKDGKLQWIQCERNNAWEEQTFSIMQFTGLKDKNGKEIYEGDVVKGYWWAYGESNRHIGVVTYGMASFKVCGVKQYLGLSDELNPVYEVIGNVYENPELVKEGNV